MTAAQRKRIGFDRFTEPQFEPYVKAIGQLALAWNSFHEVLGWTFEVLIAGAIHSTDNYKGQQVRQAWHVLNSDRDKRRLLRAAAANLTEIEKENFPDFPSDVKWILDRGDELEDMRNNVVHSPLMLISSKKRRWGLSPALGMPDYIVPQWLLGNRRALNLQQLLEKNKELLAEFRWCRDAILICRDFMVHANRSWTSARYPWPRRPSLPPRMAKKNQPRRQLHSQTAKR